jgi:uncharacterized sulfatase
LNPTSARHGAWASPIAGVCLLAMAIFTVVAGCTASPREESVVKPNIVLIIGDDHGYPYSGFMGDPIVKTPNLDRLAAGGVVFPTAYVTASTCEPSLRSILTGGEPFPRTPEQRVPPGPGWAEMNPAETLPGFLRQQGYASFQAGKHWQESYAAAGFTEGTKGEKITGGNFERMMGGREGLAIGRTTMQPVYDFIDRHAQEPFFLYFAPNLPHRPWNAPPRHREKYKPRDGERKLTGWAVGYYAGITWLDESIGALVDHLDRKGLRSRTLIVYLSDNGFELSPYEDFNLDTVEKGKDSMAESGFRTPLIFNWPGHLPEGVVRPDLVSSLDLFPTLLDFAGAPIPSNRVGIDLRSAIETGHPVPRTELIGAMEKVRPISLDRAPQRWAKRAYFIRSPRWHYVQYPDENREQLFDIQADPRERHEIAQANPDQVQAFRKVLEAWKAAGAARETAAATP